ncbi:LytTR family two component transcriptional regulator [Chitinophaga skermanii]|uniref:LytTR family two component transcriptional regulator n=1 Tax=Chitinophaga skermanii TaxID=331697 RepID=A0A327Q116_9BACT|nr:LytTR family DNA-binding domain-containing protein [Chitinophaga skermanii]RAI97723.1 LytTR family two component transcriptional regulator [Chitinophaga skermanii]
MAPSTIRCIVIDDEPDAVENIATHIERYAALELVGMYTDPVMAIAQLKHADLVFIDIEMPKLKGTDFIAEAHNQTKFIIVSAHQQYAFDGFELNVIDFLLKPVFPKRFHVAATKAIQHIAQARANTVAHTLKSGCFVRSVEEKVQKWINFEEISYIESVGKQSILHTSTETMLVTSMIREFEAQLPTDHFQRIHRSFIVSLAKIEKVIPGFVILSKAVIPIGPQYKSKLFHHGK